MFNTLLPNAHHQTMALSLPTNLGTPTNHAVQTNGIKIKTDFKSEAKEECEHEEHYAFLIENDHQITEIVQNGYQCQESNYNVIGQSKSGVYLCKYPDVALRYNEVHRYPDHFSLKMIIFKICYGKQTLALVRKDAKLAPIPATINFNSHISVIAPKENDNIETQFDHSQIFLYEYDSNKIPAKRPRHCLPYAVVTWLRTDESNEWPVNFNDLEIIPQNSEVNGLINETNGKNLVTNKEEKNEIEPTGEDESQEKKEETEKKELSEDKEKVNEQNEENRPKEEIEQVQIEEAKSDFENNSSEIKVENEQKPETVSESPKRENQNGTSTPNISQAVVQPSTPNGTPVASTTPNGTVKTAISAYPKPTAYTAYRQAIPTSLSPFVYQPSALGIRIPYASPQIPQTIGGLAQPFLNHTIQSPMQQQVFLCRGPNGLAYVTAQGLAQQQLVAAQQAQAQAILQQQLLQAQHQAAAFQKIPANQTIINGQIFQTNAAQSNQIQQVQQSPQIIYQAAPQPASQKPTQSVQQNQNSSQSQTQQAPQTQSPKSNPVSNQINGHAAVLGYNGQSTQQLYTPSPSAQAALATQQGYMLAGSNIQNQNQQLQQLQQLQQQQLLNYQLAAGGLGLNGFSAQVAGQAAGLQSAQNLTSVPLGYQLVDYRQLQGLPGTVSLEQLAGVQRSKLLQARHHPYQRP